MRAVSRTLFGLLFLAGLIVGSPDTSAYDRYKNSQGSGNCSTCHGDFTDGTSQTGASFPSNNKHTMHRNNSFMNTNCDLCHTDGDGRNPWIGSSNGVGAIQGIGCVGCHGRAEDMGNDGLSAGRGAGLRQHHDRAGVPQCRACHSDSDPANYTPVGEDTRPPYYGTAETDADEPCNPVMSSNTNENWSVGDFLGLDNDGDGDYDGQDSDCMTAPETNCFDGQDDDLDGMTDCADPDCDDVTGPACNTGQPGVCAAGTATCSNGEETCPQDTAAGTEGPFPNATCGDGLDNDCDGATDGADPDCEAPAEDCFDGTDNDLDGMVDCADPECNGSTNGSCNTGQQGICAAGTVTCDGGSEQCLANNEPQGEGPAGNASCGDGLDNDCDGATDGADPDCEAPAEDCFDGTDNDLDGMVDCADPDCNGSTNGSCNTGQQGICAAGTVTCDGGSEQCLANNEPQGEGPAGNANCEDGLDNDCDGATDGADPGCDAPAEDCFDGTDNDLDGMVDCADPDCNGSTNGSCNTGQQGICAAGTVTCDGGSEQCLANNEPQGEGPAGNANCEDGLDNDCDGATDGADPGCDAPAEDCFDGTDNDLDGMVDCADPDCNGSTNGSCNTGEPGICATGTLTCDAGSEQCLANNEPQGEGPAGNASCGDGLDNDCDGATDGADPDCDAPAEDCFDGIDNDGDDAVDCADPDCEGAVDGTCDTGQPGICTGGTIRCTNGDPTCRPDAEPQPEGNMYNNCSDGLDNDCDGAVDVEDTECDMLLADVWLKKVMAPRKRYLKLGRARSNSVFAMARADTRPQEATVTLAVEAPPGVDVTIDHDSLTQWVRLSGGESRGDDENDDTGQDGQDEIRFLRLFKFKTAISCEEAGAYTVVYTAEITAPENRSPDGDVMTATTIVVCRSWPSTSRGTWNNRGRGHRRE